jgi:heptosyltransferase-2
MVPEPDSAGSQLERLPADARFLLIRFTSLGDVVKCTALPRLIKARYPAGHVTFVTAEAYRDLIRDNPHVDRAIGFDRRGGLRGLLHLAGSLGAERWDLLVDVHKSLRSRVLRARIRAPRTAYGKRTLQRFLLINFRWNTYRRDESGRVAGKEDDFLAGLRPYGVRDDGRGTELNLAPLAGDPALARRFATELETLARWQAEGRPVLGIAPVAAWELKRWPVGHWRTLLEGFVRSTGGGVVVFGGAGDADAQALARDLGDAALSLVGRTTLLESAFFAARTSLVVSNDTGMTHLSEAAGRDAVALFGPTTRELGYFPVRPGSRVIERSLGCRPCTRTGEGRCNHPLRKACLELVAPEEVLAAVRGKLGDQPSTG